MTTQDPRWTADTEEVVARAIHRASCYANWEECWDEGVHHRAVNQVLTALADDGHLTAPAATQEPEQAEPRVWATPHAWTSHGHRCCRTPGPALGGGRPQMIARCGGPGLCARCAQDAVTIHGSQT